MIYREFIPSPLLQHQVKCFWIFENSYGDNHLERMIPDGYLDFVFHYGQRPKLIIEGKEIHKTENFLGGHLVNAGMLKFSGDLKMFGIKFHPWASASLYQMPAHELNNLRIPVKDIMGKWANEYACMMYEELNKKNYERVITQLETVLKKKFLQPSDNRQKILKCSFEKIASTNGSVSIDAVSSNLGVSTRYLQKIFKEKKGMPFQHYCRMIRLQKVLQHIKTGNFNSLTDLTYSYGYYDQSHFIKDFNSFTGLSPKKFIKEEHLYISQNLHTILPD